MSSICRIPTKLEYLTDVGVLKKDSDNIYKYMNFNQMTEFTEKADTVAA